MPNHLASSTSPYLLQHVNNPVDWYPWGKDAIEKARSEDKPIFLSIGYAACHWCHVMAHESFEDPEIAAIMNTNYVCIKVDREERPDLDSIYMAAVVALTGQGGWPMSVFLTPDLTPFYGGTYFPPKSKFGLPAFKEVLLSLSDHWQQKREEVIRASQQIITHLNESTNNLKVEAQFSPDVLTKATHSLINTYDWQFGGWGAAPKFPQPMVLEFLLRRHLSVAGDVIKPVLHALRTMARGGMYDVVGGGFARYSTDTAWHIPHFEKMLYDNAQLAQVYLHSWQITGELSFRHVVEDTLAFVIREMLSTEGGFYSSLDADSEGKEGKFYIWTLAEIRSVFGEKDDFFETAYGLKESGNWEGKIVLQRMVDDSDLASRFGLCIDEINKKLWDRHAQLLVVRNTRIHPATDDKVLTFWNGLMLSVFAEAARVFDNDQYLQVARKNADFILTSLRPDGKLHHVWRKGQVSQEVFLEDYASLILGLLDLYQVDFDNRWYSEAYGLAEEMIQRFNDPRGGFFDITNDAEIVIARPKELQDNATPSGNALAAEVLFKLAAFSENGEWRNLAENMLGLVTNLSSDHPWAFSRWLSSADFNFNKVRQVAIVGDMADIRTRSFLTTIRKSYTPNMIIAASNYPIPGGSPALLADRPMIEGNPTVYVCEGFICKLPVTTIEGLEEQLL